MADDKSPLGTRYVERFLRRAFGLAGPTVANKVGGELSPSIDMRPILPWEFRDFFIHPFARSIQQAGVAAQFSYVEFQPSLDLYDIIITDIFNGGAGAINVFLNNTTQGAAASNPLPFELDSNFAPGTYGTQTVPIFCRTGSVAAIAGGNIDNIAIGGSRVNREILLRGENGTRTPNLVIAGSAVNTAISVIVYGRIIPQDNTLI